MKKISKKGFTLVELLAIIVVLAVIALTTTPMIIGSLDNARKNTFKSSVEGMIRAVQTNQSENDYGAEKYVVNNGAITTSKGTKLSVKGGTSESGTLDMSEDGLVAAAIYNGTWCATKKGNESHVTITKTTKDKCK